MGAFTEFDITQRMIQAGRHAANLPDDTLARIYVAMRAAERGFDVGEIVGGDQRPSADYQDGFNAANERADERIRQLEERVEDKGNALRVEIAAKQMAYNEIKDLEAENARLRRIATDGPATSDECKEFCRCAIENGDSKPCLDCSPENFHL